MADIENVIKGIEKCIAIPGMCSGCPYERCDEAGRQLRDCSTDLLRDALELLKEQQAEIERLNTLLKEKQAIKPTCKEIIHKGKKYKRWSCGRCGRSVKIGEGKYSANFCQHCGFPVKWKDD